MCVDCRNIRVELASIVVHKQKRPTEAQKALNAQKISRRTELLALLHSHDCPDRISGRLIVPDDRSRTLSAVRACWRKPVKSIDPIGLGQESPAVGGDMKEAHDDSSSDTDGMPQPVCGLYSAMPKSISLPTAYTRRGPKVLKDMVVAVPCSANEGDFMAGQPFWLAKVLRITPVHVTLHYYGDTFLGVYKLLDDEEILQYQRKDITILHWNIKFVGKYKHCGGRLSKGDQRVLSLDVRVPWTLPEHSSAVLGKKKKRKITAPRNNNNKKRRT